MWKGANLVNCPHKIGRLKHGENDITTREMTNEKFWEQKITNTFLGDAIRLCNKAPEDIRLAKSIGIAKKKIWKSCQTFPI